MHKMNETTLPPSPNWYLSNILTCTQGNNVAWGSRNAIVIASPDEQKSSLKYSIIKNAHKDRVTAVCFAPHVDVHPMNDNLLASIGDDENIKIWNIKSFCLAYSRILDKGKQAVAIDWSNHESLAIYYLTTDGFLVLWNLQFDTISVFTIGKISGVCISCCPHKSNIVAIGTKNGLVYIVNCEGTGIITYKLRGHDVEVISLSWCPSDTNILSSKNSKDLLLASGGRDRSIFIWRAGSDGRCEVQLSVPNNPLDSGQRRSKLNASVGNWITVCWVKPTLLLTSTIWAELICWDFSKCINGKPAIKLLHSQHLRGLFSIACKPCISSSTNDTTTSEELENSFTVWTAAQDRQVVCCNVTEKEVHVKYTVPTQGGYIYCIAACPLEVSQLAFGVGDATLRLWSLSEMHSTSSELINVTMLWQKIKGKVRAVSWHPEKENLLAYATDEGRVGVFDINSSNKPPILYKQYHRDKVYSLGWGPHPDKEQTVLYSCAERELVFYDPEKPNQAPTSVLKKECTEFAWKPDFSCVAVGLEEGSIVFFNRSFAIQGRIKHGPKKSVHCLAWHPESTATDLSFSFLRNYLAVAHDSNIVTVFDLSKMINNLQQQNTNEHENVKQENNLYTTHEVVASLHGHTDKVVCLAWSPHLAGQLISGSYDHTAQVWSVETQKLLATYTGHCGPVLCAMWSPLHSDFVITGSADFTLRIWRVTDQTVVTPIATSKKQHSKKNKNKTQHQPNRSVNTSSDNVGIKQTVETKQKNTKRVSYFEKGTKLFNDKNALLTSLMQLIQNNSGKGLDSQSEICMNSQGVLPLFSNRTDLLSHLEDERRALTAKERHSVATELSVWCDDLKTNLEEATKEKRLNDFLVSLAPSVSMKMWKEICEAYANQLIGEGNPEKAASYFLCIHKTYKAITVFENAHLYKEAYAIAQCKLDSNDPVVSGILDKWANYCVLSGQFEQAAHIYAKMGLMDKCIKYLARRADASTLSIAADIAVSADDEATAISLAEESIYIAFLREEYDVARTVIAKFPQLKYREFHMSLLMKVKEICRQKVELSAVRKWMEGKSDYNLLNVFESESKIYDSSIFSGLDNNSVRTDCENEKMLWIAVSYELMLATTCEKSMEKIKHVVLAFSFIFQFELLHRKNCADRWSLAIALAINLENNKPLSEESIYRQIESLASISLRGYLCLALMNWLVYDVCFEEEEYGKHQAELIGLISDLLDSALCTFSVRHWSASIKINKLETELSSILSEIHEESSADTENTKIDLLKEELNQLRSEKKQFVDERISVANPMLVYAAANELVSKIVDEDTKTNFANAIAKIWASVVSSM